MAYEVVVEHLNHLGIVAEVCREIGVAEWLDAQAPTSRQQVSVSRCSARITGAPSNGSAMPIAMTLRPVQVLRQKSRAARSMAAPSLSGNSGTRLGKRRTPAL